MQLTGRGKGEGRGERGITLLRGAAGTGREAEQLCWGGATASPFKLGLLRMMTAREL